MTYWVWRSHIESAPVLSLGIGTLGLGLGARQLEQLRYKSSDDAMMNIFMRLVMIIWPESVISPGPGASVAPLLLIGEWIECSH